MNSGTWWRINQPGRDPVRELQQVAIETMRTWKLPYREDELQFVREDPTFHDSTKDAYWEIRGRFDRKMSLPGHLTVRFRRPGTRNGSDREVGE